MSDILQPYSFSKMVSFLLQPQNFIVSCWQFVLNQIAIINQMFFKEDSIEDFINYKIKNPQALQEEMKMLKDRQDCTKKLNEYAKQMELLKNEYNMYKELLDASLAKKQYLQQTYEQNKEELDEKISKCKEQIDSNNREIKYREAKNEQNRKMYGDFQKDIAIKKDKLTEYHLSQLSSLSNYSQSLKKSIYEKREKKAQLEEELKTLTERQKVIQDATQNSQVLKNKWTLKNKQLQRMREEEAKKEKEIKDQIKNTMSMEKVIYGNFYKRCTQIVTEMKNGLDVLFDKNAINVEGSNLEQKLEKMLQQQKIHKQNLTNFINEKRQKYKIGTLLPEADAQVYNNIVQTKINPELLPTINPSEYRNNDLILEEIEKGLVQMFQKLEEERKESLQRQKMKIRQIEELEQRVKDFQIQIETKKKQSSPTKKGKKN